MIDFLLAVLTLAVLIGLTAALAAPCWPRGRDVLCVRGALGLLAALIYLAVFLQVYGFDRGVLTAMVVGVPQQQARAPQGSPPGDQQPVAPAKPQG